MSSCLEDMKNIYEILLNEEDKARGFKESKTKMVCLAGFRPDCTGKECPYFKSCNDNEPYEYCSWTWIWW
jgi:hypothetical protein